MCCFHSLYFFQAFDNKISEYGNGLHVSYRKLRIRSQSKRNVRRLQISKKRREAKGKGEKERYTQLNAEFQRIARRDKKALLSDQHK